MKPETKYKGSIKLSAIGDALGWITEFEKNTLSLKEKFGTERIDKFYSWKKPVGGRFYGFIDNINAGSYSDDTQLLLAVARSIKKDGSLDHNYFAKIELPNWLDYARGGGRTVKTAADKISRKSVKWYNNFYNFKVNGINYDYKNSGANGAAMRVLPIALANLGDVEKIKEEIFCNSIITHGHPRAILGAMLYGYAINQIIMYRPEDFNWDKYITQIGTDFQNKVWSALCTIPYGDVRTYKQIAQQIGHPKAYRAVGGACNRNPIGLIVPCHRVLGSNQSLTGYAGGLDLKELLLKLEDYIVVSTLLLDSKIKDDNYIDLSKESKTIEDFTYIVSLMDKIITTDTSTYHISDAFIIPTIVIFTDSKNLSKFIYENDNLTFNKFESWKRLRANKIIKLLDSF